MKLQCPITMERVQDGDPEFFDINPNCQRIMRYYIQEAFQAFVCLALCIHPNVLAGCWLFQDPVRGEHCEHTWRAQNMERHPAPVLMLAPLVLRCTWQNISGYFWIDNLVSKRGHVYMPQIFESASGI